VFGREILSLIYIFTPFTLLWWGYPPAIVWLIQTSKGCTIAPFGVNRVWYLSHVAHHFPSINIYGFEIAMIIDLSHFRFFSIFDLSHFRFFSIFSSFVRLSLTHVFSWSYTHVFI